MTSGPEGPPHAVSLMSGLRRARLFPPRTHRKDIFMSANRRFSSSPHLRTAPSFLALPLLFWANVSNAQEGEAEVEEPIAEETEGEAEAAAPTEATAEATAPAEEEPPAEAAPEQEEPPAEEATDTEEAEEAAAEPAEEEFKPSFTVGAGLRSGLNLNLTGDAAGELSLNDGLVDQVHIRPYMGGSLTPNVGFFVQFEVGTPAGLGSFAILDGMAQIKVVDELQVWVGQHIPANDRNNMNGPFFGNTWNFAIAVEEYPFDVGARDRGATVWGLIADGHVKYHVSMVDLQPGQEIGEARGAGRLTFHFWEPENFYYNSGTYFGKQDVLTVGAVMQGQKGAEDDSDLLGFSFDGMMEKNFGKGGTLTLEAGYWNFENTGENYIVNQSTVDEGRGIPFPMTYPGSAYMGVISWLTPDKVGPGQLQPNARIQYADWATQSRMVLDVGLAYVIDGFNHKYHLNYRHAETDPDGGDTISADSIQVGFQYLMGL